MSPINGIQNVMLKYHMQKDMKAFEDQDKGQRINAVDALKVKTES
jgi:hypothetical protein